VFVVELFTREGRVSERYETYEAARQRVEQFPPESLVGLPLIFKELADGSERVVREDGKPLQFHRRLAEQEKESPEDPIPLSEDSSGLVGPDGKLRFVDPRQTEEGWDALPLA
jgi:hypothetical protein